MDQHNNKIKPIYWQHILLVIFFVLLCALLQTFNGTNWASLYVGEPLSHTKWRLITAHLVHLDWHHYIMNMIGLGLCVAVYVKEVSAKHWYLSFVVLSLCSSIGLIYWPLDYDIYVGFSDVLHGWILIGATTLFKTDKKIAAIIYVLFISKLIQENMGMMFLGNTDMEANMSTESHILGSSAGTLYALAVFYVWPAIASSQPASTKKEP